MSTICVWWDDAADGVTNMAADECLADVAVARQSLCLRIYGWTAATVSLGAFQRIAEARACPAIAAVPLVRRPSGGGAIIHGSDLTYAAAVPKTHPWGTTAQTLYDALHAEMVAVLRDRGVAARPSRSATADGDGAAFMCFDRRAIGDIVVDLPGGDAKLMGSAQRRLAGAVLQHGSLLVDRNPAVTGAAAHPGLATLAPAALVGGPAAIAAAWLDRVAAAAGATIERQPLPFAVEHAAAVAAGRRRFAAENWLSRR